MSRQQSHVIGADASLILAPSGAPWTLAVLPEGGATVTVAISVTPAAAIGADGAGAAWHALGDALSAPELIAFPSPVTAIRVSSAAGGATVELVG